MFLANLSTSVLKLCDIRKSSATKPPRNGVTSVPDTSQTLSRGKTAPTILTLEKLCAGFDLTPNDQLIPSEVWREMAFREPMPVTQIRCFRCLYGLTGFPVCPQCGKTMDREYQPYYDRYGQCLDWNSFSKATIILPQK